MARAEDLSRIRQDRELLLRALGDAGAELKSHKVRCPFHDDTNPSGSIHHGDDGVWRYVCHANCGWNDDKSTGDVIDVMMRTQSFTFGQVVDHLAGRLRRWRKASMSKKMDGKARSAVKTASGERKVFPTPQDVLAHYQKDGRATMYEYVVGGSTAMLVVRVEYDPPRDGQKKDFRPYRPVDGGWGLGDPPGKLPLYRVDELPEDKSQPIFVLEGEKDADFAAQIGLHATTSAHGSNAAQKSDWMQLKGRPVVILRDNDKGGERYGADICEILFDQDPDATVRVLTLPGVPPKGSIIEFVKPLGECIDPSGAILDVVAKTRPIDPYAGMGLVLVDAVSVAETPTRWLWPDHIPIGALTVIAGPPGVGKSFVTLDIAARVTTGRPFFGQDKAIHECGDVLCIACEDDFASVMRKRAREAGVDLSRFHPVEGVVRELHGPMEFLTLDRDLVWIRRTLERQRAEGRPIRLMIIDPLVAFLGAVDAHKDAEIYGLLMPMADLASKFDVAVILVQHIRKSSGSGIGLHRISGGQAFGAACRAAWIIGRDPDDRSLRAMAPEKSSFASDRCSLTFRIGPDERGRVCVLWDDSQADVTADDMFEQPQRRGPRPEQREEAIEWLRERLAAAAEPSTEVYAAARSDGISERTLRRAIKDLGVRSYKTAHHDRTRTMLQLDTADSSKDESAN